MLIANRLIRPSSEHGLSRWLDIDFVGDRRFVPHWHQRGRVQVDSRQLQTWYRTLDRLVAAKSRLEVALYGRLRDLFSLKPKLVLYDITSPYFEGAGPEGFARHGYSRAGKPQNVQVVVGLLGVRRRQNAELDGYLQCIDEGRWQDCTVGITSRAKKNKPPRTRVQEVAATPTPEDAATQHRIPRWRHGHRYFDWALRDGVFHFFDHPVNLEREKRLEGKYVLMTSWTKQSGAA